MIKTHQVKIKPNANMRRYIGDLFNYRRYIWNQSLDEWNNQYSKSVKIKDKSLTPSERKVRKKLTANKEKWQYNLSSRVPYYAVFDLSRAWKAFFNPSMPNSKKPKFKSKKNYKPTFTTDRAKVVGTKLYLDKPRPVNSKKWYPIKMCEPLRFNGVVKLVTITQKADGLYASIVIDTSHISVTPLKQGVTGIDVNVKHFNHKDGVVNIYPDKLEKYYTRISYYQKSLARKRLNNPRNYKTKRYTKVKAKLRRDYQKVSSLQKDILNKFTTDLVRNYGEIHIEDLDVRAMTMSKKMGKNLHRSLFGELAINLSYKCEWNNRKLVIVDRLYPSTQICSECGYRKTKDSYGGKQTLYGDSIYHQHQVYRCYECGAVLDRDENAVQNIINYVE